MRDLIGPRWMNRAEKKNKGRRQPHTVSDKDKAHRQERWSSCWRNKFGRKRIWKASNFRQKFQRPWEFTEGSGRREHQSDEESSIDDLIRWSIHTSSCGNPRQDWVGEGEATGPSVCLFAAWWRAKETGAGVATRILRLLALKQEERWCRWQKQRRGRPAWGWGRG